MSVVEVAGELDILTAPKLITALDREHASAAMVLDLAKVTFMSSTGVALIVSLHRRLTRRGGHLALASLQPLVARLLEISGLAEALLIGDDVPAAIGLVAERL